MTRTVTLADIAPSRAAMAGKNATDSGAKQAASDCDDAATFAQVLDNVGSTDGKPAAGGEHDGRQDERRKTDDGSSPGSVTPTVAASAAQSLVPTSRDNGVPPVTLATSALAEPRPRGASSPAMGGLSSDAGSQAARSEAVTSAAAAAGEGAAPEAAPAAEAAIAAPATQAAAAAVASAAAATSATATSPTGAGVPVTEVGVPVTEAAALEAVRRAAAAAAAAITTAAAATAAAATATATATQATAARVVEAATRAAAAAISEAAARAVEVASPVTAAGSEPSVEETATVANRVTTTATTTAPATTKTPAPTPATTPATTKTPAPTPATTPAATSAPTAATTPATTPATTKTPAPTPATATTASTVTENADSSDRDSQLNARAFSQAAISQAAVSQAAGSQAAVSQAAFPLRQNVVISDPPPASHDGPGTQSRDANDGTGGDTPATSGRLSGAGAVASPPVGIGSVTTSFLGATSGQFAVHLDGTVHLEGGGTPGSAQLSPRSDFIVSNAALTAAISKPINEGSGVFSVTAMLSPPSLGHVQAVVKVDGTNVNVSIVAHTPEGHQAIAGHLDELRQELQGRGGDVQLSLSDGGGRGRQHDETDSPVALGEDAEDASTLLPAVTPAQAGKSLHVIL